MDVIIKPNTTHWTTVEVKQRNDTHLAHAVQLLGQRAQVLLADQRVDVLLDVGHKLLPGRQLVGSAQLPPGRQGGQQPLRQQRHGAAPLLQVERAEHGVRGHTVHCNTVSWL